MGCPNANTNAYTNTNMYTNVNANAIAYANIDTNMMICLPLVCLLLVIDDTNTIQHQLALLKGILNGKHSILNLSQVI